MFANDLKVAIIGRLYYLTIAYDTSADIGIKDLIGEERQGAMYFNILRPWIKWDAVYFMHILTKGYVYEQEFAFFPMIAIFIEKNHLPLVTWILCQISVVLSAVIFSRLTMFIFKDKNFSQISLYIYVFNPANAFLSGMYTECLFNMFSMAGLLLFYQRKNFLSALCFLCSSLTRSNGIVLAGFFIFAALHREITVYKALILCFTVFIGFISVLWKGYSEFCDDVSAREWCSHRIPNIYSFVQSHYWYMKSLIFCRDVGLFKYYETKQIPNFAIASPVLLFSLYSIYRFIIQYPKLFFSLGFRKDKGIPAYMNVVLPHIYLWLFLTIYSILLIHIQVI
ncbi:hypothetical protein ROZALSC1DRAFT_28507 [Rozella allomycis CSF55]|uniref:GPI mannosyltransferase 2 n=1 Tax=Rozella allomycis (strain CSF55) TaxID=988480 RepID=A0A4P9YLA1_ROZAC|nr:hypothetical protein ROZALSC1DRAFT_28507 [Rozella allomycis CSF55]